MHINCPIYCQSHNAPPPTMLKFIEKNTQSDHPRTPIRYHPQKTYGNSYEAPSQFINDHSIINDHSYFNPFLKYKPAERKLLSERQYRSVDPRGTGKSNHCNLASSHLIESTQRQNLRRNQGREGKGRDPQRQRYQEQMASDPLRFRLAKGEFTEYLNKNHHYQSMGPLQGQERSDQRIQLTKSTMKQRQQEKIEQLTTSSKFKTELYNTIKSNLIQNSSLLTQRSRIKKNREIIHRNFRRDIEQRQKDTSYCFNMPHLTSKEHALIELLHPSTRRYKTES